MGFQDFYAFFDQVDKAHVGHLTAGQLQELYEMLYFTSVSLGHVEAAIQLVCGADKKVTKDLFISVLEEIDRRQAVEEQAYWDFQALDYNGDNRIGLKDALMLFQEFHGEDFSVETWQMFLTSRDLSDEEVHFDELRTWLCDIPTGDPSSNNEAEVEEKRLDQRKMMHTMEQYDTLKKLRNEGDVQDETNLYQDDTRRHAKRRLNKWNKQGVEAMLFDDGTDVEMEDVPQTRTRESVSMADLVAALDLKYTLLQDKLLMVMAKYAQNMDGEHTEIFNQLKRDLRCIKPENIEEEIWNLPGAHAALPSSLLGMMGELPGPNADRLKSVEAQRAKLEAEGKSVKEVDNILKRDYESITEGPEICGKTLVKLQERHHLEKTALMTRVHGSSVTSGAVAMVLECINLSRQQHLLEEDMEFSTMALAVGLAERPPADLSSRYNWDRVRSEELASQRLEQRQGHRPVKSSGGLTESKGQGRLDLQLQLVAEIERKQFLEREAFIYMLQGYDINTAVAAAQKMSSEERYRKRITLRNQHNNWRDSSITVENRSDKSAGHYRLLQEAVGMYWVSRQNELEEKLTNLGDKAISAAMMADLQQTQERECWKKLQEIPNKTSADLSLMLKQESKARVFEFFDNIAFVVLGAQEIGEGEHEYIDMLNEKYRALRIKVLLFALRDRWGSEWQKMPSEKKEKELVKLRKEEKNLRAEGKLKEMEQIIGPKCQTLPSLFSLLGENKEYPQVSTERKLGGNALPPVNLLADLVTRYDCEQDSLLSWLQSPEVRAMPGSQRRLQLLQSQLEKESAMIEDDFEVAFLSAGLLERVQKSPWKRSKEDKDRQFQLARKRVQIRRKRLQQGEVFEKISQQTSAPRTGDIIEWRQVYMAELRSRHTEERELLLNLLQDETLMELTEAAAMMSEEERQGRLAELQSKRKKLDLNKQDDKEEYICVLEEAAAIKSVCKKTLLLKTSPGQTLTPDDLAAALLIDLQNRQDIEIADVLTSLGRLDENNLRQLWSAEVCAQKVGSAQNVFLVLTSYDGDAGDERLNQLLDEKYTVLREKLLLESIAQQHGDKARSIKQKQIQAMKQKLEILWKQGDLYGLADLLGPNFKLTQNIQTMMGIDRREFTKRQLQQPGSPQFIEENAAKESNGHEAATELFGRFCTEKLFITDYLQGIFGDVPSPRDRQVMLSRLQREISLAAADNDFRITAIVTGLVERQTTDKKCMLINDRKRYVELAGSDRSEMKSGKVSKVKSSEEIVRSSDRVKLQDSVLHILNEAHHNEQEVFVTLLKKSDHGDLCSCAAVSTEQQRSDMLNKYRSRRDELPTDDTNSNMAILQEATVVKKESRRGKLASVHGSVDSIVETDLCASLVADLLQQQNVEAEKIFQKFANQGSDDLIHMQMIIRFNQKHSRCDNIAAVLFMAEMSSTGSDNELIDALNDKYDALKDKLLVQALMNQMGEADWLNLTEKERQRHLLELKLKQKQLRRDGKMDEIAALLGDALNNQEALKKLMGDNQADHERKLKEKLARRKQRLAQGLTEEECDQLEEQDTRREEEEEKKQRKNILLELNHRLEEEKAELLRQMMSADDNLDRERQRQAALMRLKREQRRVREEDRFDSAALMLGLAEEHEKKVQTHRDEERQRQERLAQERLEAARQKRRQGKEEDEDPGHWEDVDDHMLVETLMTTIDKKHRAERNLLMQCLDENIELKTVAGMSTEDLEARLSELADMRDMWRKADTAVPEKQTAIFQEAVNYALEIKGRELRDNGKEASENDLKVAILADLQQLQDTESSTLMADAENKDVETLKLSIQTQTKAKEEGWLDNLAAVLLTRDKAPIKGEAEEKTNTEKQLVQALEKKYDAMRDKLIIEALMKQMGEADWARLSELERQRRVIKMRVEERRLRQEGRMDEVAALLGRYFDNEKGLTKLLGDSKLSQQQSVEARLKRRQQLKAEREAAGLAVDDTTLDTIQEDEASQAETTNVMENLQYQFEKEKTALLAMMNKQTDNFQAERERQLSLAKLRRDQKRLAQEDNLESACLIFSLGQQAEADCENSFTQERERQRQLAQERLASRRQRRQSVKEADTQRLQQKLREDIAVEGDHGRDETAIEESLLEDMEQRHADERDVLFQLLQAAQADTKTQSSLQKQSQEDLRRELARFHKDHSKWLAKSRQAVMTATLVSSSSLPEVAERRGQQFELLTRAMIYRLEVEGRLLRASKPDLTPEDLKEELSVSLLADLQQKQGDDVTAIQDMMKEKNQDFLMKVKNIQRAAKIEGWFENLTFVLFSVRDVSEEANIPDLKAAERELEAEFEKEKQELIEKALREAKPGETIDTDALLKELETQHAAKKEAILSELERQRQMIQERIEAKKRSRLDKEFDEATAVHLIKMAECQTQAAQDKVEGDRGRQGSVLQERLAARRQARKRAAKEGDDMSRPESKESTASRPGLLRREKTVVDIEVTEDQKQAVSRQLVRQQMNLHHKISEEQARQEQMLKRRLEIRKGKRQNEAAELFSLGERQKTTLEKSQKEERERQQSLITERVARARYERTKTQHASPSESVGKSFDEMEEEKDGLSRDEKMELTAKQMQEKFEQEAQAKQKESSEGQLLDNKARFELLKAKKQRRKKEKEEDLEA